MTSPPQPRSAPPTATPEDLRTATSLHVQLSSQLMSAGMATMALGGVVATIVFQGRDPEPLFGVLIVLSALLLLVSLVLGGMGVSKAAKAGADGRWGVDTADGRFNWQAILALLAVVTFLVALGFVGSASEAVTPADSIKALTEQLKGIRSELRVIATK